MNLNYPTVVAELVAVIIALLATAALPRSFIEPLSDRIGALGRFVPTAAWAQVLLVALIAIAARAIILPWLDAPVPLVHDEHSHMLLADTFLEGRLSNPAHPFWEHFESFHIIVQPTYSSMFFPGRALPMVIGELLFGHPWPGVWLSFIGLAAATVWMLRGWLPANWAFLGGLLIVGRLGLYSFWINSYWGGAVTALGAMLVVGAFPRLLARPRLRDGILLGTGVLLLIATRPFEGFFLCAGLGLFALPRLWRAEATRLRTLAVRGAVPLLVLAGAGAGLVAVHNQAATGSAFKTPYTLNRNVYAVSPAFLTQDRLIPDDRSFNRIDHVRAFYRGWEPIAYRMVRRNPLEYFRLLLRKLVLTWQFYLGWSLLIPFLAGLWLLRREPLVLGTLIFFIPAMWITPWPRPHYFAPIFPLLLLPAMAGLGAMSAREPRLRVLAAVLAGATALTGPIMATLSLTTGWPRFEPNYWDAACCATVTTFPKSEVEARLAQLPGADLVLVRATRASPAHSEVVYNKANIDAAPVVWARSLGPDKDAALLRYFSGRQVWIFEWLPAEISETTIPPYSLIKANGSRARDGAIHKR